MTHPRNQSALYKVTSPSMLARRLGISERDLIDLVEGPDQFARWTDRKSGRAIQEPRGLLAKVHRRVAELLARIELPDFLHSARKGRSYITNATLHGASVPCAKIDLRKFYVSARSQEVFHFFKDRMLCAPDVAGILTKLLTVDGHLATGSSVSPILSFFAYEELFHELNLLAGNRGCTMSLYVDDVVFTGWGATRRIIFEAKRIVSNWHLEGHKVRLFKGGQSRVVTGVAITKVGIRVPNRRKSRIIEDTLLFRSLPDSGEKLIVARRLTGRLFEASQVDPRWRARAERMAALRGELESFRHEVKRYTKAGGGPSGPPPSLNLN